jgi:preprotein translocase subunit SecG
LELLLISVHLISSIILIILVLLQQGKGAEAGATLGGGDNSSLFGPMTENPLQNATTIIAVIFMTTSVSLAYKARFPGSSDEPRFFKESVTSAPLIHSGTEETESGGEVLDELGIPDGSTENIPVEKSLEPESDVSASESN